MARILTQIDASSSGKWFEQIEPSTLREAEFERLVLLHAASAYPDYFVIPFKRAVPTTDPRTGEVVNVKPDLAFIAKDYQEWWVVEIEMGYHQLNSHVIPQVQKLAGADYSVDTAEYLAKQRGLCETTLQRLISLNDTRVLVIANQHKEEWVKPLRNLGVFMAVFESYRDDDGDEVFRANGVYPSTISEMISKCRDHPTIKSLLGIETPENLNLPRNQDIFRLRYNNCITEWRRADADGIVWLHPISRSPLRDKRSYQIVRQSDGQLELREE